MNEQQLGILLAILQQVGFTFETSVIHAFGSSLTAPEMSLLRCLGGVAIALMAALILGPSILRTQHPWLQIARGFVTAGFGFAMMWAFVAIPLLDATALSYLTAIWTVALAPAIGERYTVQRIAAVLIGFLGALLIIRPSFSDASIAYAVFAVATAMNGINYLLNRFMQHGDQADSSFAVLFYANSIAAILTAPIVGAGVLSR